MAFRSLGVQTFRKIFAGFGESCRGVLGLVGCVGGWDFGCVEERVYASGSGMAVLLLTAAVCKVLGVLWLTLGLV